MRHGREFPWSWGAGRWPLSWMLVVEPWPISKMARASARICSLAPTEARPRVDANRFSQLSASYRRSTRAPKSSTISQPGIKRFARQSTINDEVSMQRILP